MKTSKFLRKPFLAFGAEVTIEDADKIAKWCDGQLINAGTEHVYIRVPVLRVTSRRQTEARLGDWVLKVGNSWKVYTKTWLESNFFQVDDADDVVDEEGDQGNRICGNVRDFPATPANMPMKNIRQVI